MRQSHKLATAAIVGLVSLGSIGCSHLRRDEDAITKDLECTTPIGSQYDVVLKTLKSKYSHVTESDHGFLSEGDSHFKEVGVKSLDVLLGEYRGFPVFGLVTSVEAFWGFDQSGKLTEISVQKTTDGP